MTSRLLICAVLVSSLVEMGCAETFCNLGQMSGLGCERMAGSAREAGDARRSAQLYLLACRQGSGAACRELAEAYLRGSGVRVNGPRAQRLFDTGCGQLDPESCYSLANYLELSGAPADEIRRATRRAERVEETLARRARADAETQRLILGAIATLSREMAAGRAAEAERQRLADDAVAATRARIAAEREGRDSAEREREQREGIARQERERVQRERDERERVQREQPHATTSSPGPAQQGQAGLVERYPRRIPRERYRGLIALSPSDCFVRRSDRRQGAGPQTILIVDLENTCDFRVRVIVTFPGVAPGSPFVMDAGERSSGGFGPYGGYTEHFYTGRAPDESPSVVPERACDTQQGLVDAPAGGCRCNPEILGTAGLPVLEQVGAQQDGAPICAEPCPADYRRESGSLACVRVDGSGY